MSRAGELAQLLECMPAIHKALGSSPNTTLTRSREWHMHSALRRWKQEALTF